MARPEALVLVAKEIDGQEVQGRFMPPLSGPQADELARAFLADAADMARAAAMDTDIWCSVESDDLGVRSFMPPEVRMMRSRGYTYGERLAAIVDDLMSQSYKRVVMVAADCPTIDPAYVRAAFEALRDHDAVVGPAIDGGYVVMGVTKSMPRLFLDIEMGTPDVMRQTLMRARSLELRMGVLPARRGLESWDDVRNASTSGELTKATHTSRLVDSVDA